MYLDHSVSFVSQHGQVGDADAKKFKSQVYFAVTLGEYLQYGLIVVGGLLILSAITIGCCSSRKKQSVSEALICCFMYKIINAEWSDERKVCLAGYNQRCVVIA